MKKSLWKILSFGGLAVFMGVATVLGGMATLPVVFTAKAETQQSGLGLDPENDPVVFTTKEGLEIRKHEAVVSGSGQIITTTTCMSNANISSVQDLTNLYYFTMGTYSGTILTGRDATESYAIQSEPVNWIIIGRGSYPGVELDEETSPAAQAIKNDVNKELREFFTGPFGVVQNAEIEAGCVLVLSEKLLGCAAFNGSGITTYGQGNLSYYHSYSFKLAYCNGSRYRWLGDVASNTGTMTQSWLAENDGVLYSAVNNLFKKNVLTGAIINNELGFTAEQASLIRPQGLTTVYGNVDEALLDTFSETPDDRTWHTMFPLARTLGGYTQNFCVETYLTTTSRRIATLIGSDNLSYPWYSRTGAPNGPRGGYICNAKGDWINNGIWDIQGVRPAFVMEFVPDLIG